jgi:hypothetical protein
MYSGGESVSLARVDCNTELSGKTMASGEVGPSISYDVILETGCYIALALHQSHRIGRSLSRLLGATCTTIALMVWLAAA